MQVGIFTFMYMCAYQYLFVFVSIHGIDDRYIQQQQINGYQQESDLFCVLATYTTNRSVKVPFFKEAIE